MESIVIHDRHGSTGTHTPKPRQEFAHTSHGLICITERLADGVCNGSWPLLAAQEQLKISHESACRQATGELSAGLTAESVGDHKDASSLVNPEAVFV
jgi:hypothetical protein